MRNPIAIFMWCLLIGNLGSSFYLVHSADKLRKLNQAVWLSHRNYDELLDDYGRLRLEYGALTSLPRVEQLARSELGMMFPETIHQAYKK